jgi:hypothetical protein
LLYATKNFVSIKYFVKVYIYGNLGQLWNVKDFKMVTRLYSKGRSGVTSLRFCVALVFISKTLIEIQAPTHSHLNKTYKTE